MVYIIIFLVIVVGIIIYFYTRKTPEIVPEHKVVEAIANDDVCSIVKNEEIKPNKTYIIGVDRSFVLFVNDTIAYKEDNYNINFDNLAKYMIDEDDKDDLLKRNTSKNIITCFKVHNGNILNINSNYDSPIQFYDDFYEVLIMMKLSVQTIFKIIDQEKFIKNIAGFGAKMTKRDFEKTVTSIIQAKIYGSVSSYVKDKKISYLHISLYKHEIEARLQSDLNEYLEVYGLNIVRLLFTNISNNDDKEFKFLSDKILEKSRMGILNYTYKDRMNNELGIHPDLQKVDQLTEAAVYIKK